MHLKVNQRVFKSTLKVKALTIAQNMGQSHYSHKSASNSWLQLLLNEDRARCAITKAMNVLAFKVSSLFTCRHVSSPANDEFMPSRGRRTVPQTSQFPEGHFQSLIPSVVLLQEQQIQLQTSPPPCPACGYMTLET